MDTARFDAVARSLAAGGSRRVALGVLAGGFLTLCELCLGDSHGQARKKGKRKRKRKPCRCGFCEACRGGLCVPLADGTDCGECGICAAGSCVPKVNQTLCDLCTTCEGGMCVNKPLGFPCSAFGQCDSGECVFPPGCDAFPTPCATGAACCSGACCTVLAASYCCRSEVGARCYDDGDCVEGASCLAYRCFRGA